MTAIWALLPADGAEMFWAGLNRAALQVRPDDSRTADQRRADALVEIGLAALWDPALPGALPTKPAVNITVGLATLLGDNDQPAELDGYGPIPASMARRIAEDPSGTWRRLITDEAGKLLDYGTTTYKPPADLARHVKMRDRKCVIPGCGRRAVHCEVDHEVPFPRGGTNARNLRPLCKRHHIMKTHSRGGSTANPTAATRPSPPPDIDGATDHHRCRYPEPNQSTRRSNRRSNQRHQHKRRPSTTNHHRSDPRGARHFHPAPYARPIMPNSGCRLIALSGVVARHRLAKPLDCRPARRIGGNRLGRLGYRSGEGRRPSGLRIRLPHGRRAGPSGRFSGHWSNALEPSPSDGRGRPLSTIARLADPDWDLRSRVAAELKR